MSFLEVMQSRYTTKKFDASKKITPENIEALKEILQLAPSSINSQPWKFTFVSNSEIKAKLADVSWINTPKILNCDTLIVLSRVKSLEAFEARIEKELPQGAVGFYNDFIKKQPEPQIYAWFEKQVYLALGVLLSACADMGIDATPMEGIEPDAYDTILGQKEHATLVAVAIGYRDADDTNQPHIKPKSRTALKNVIEEI
ncbi:nitroreductase family protein [Leeuwenhoekiella sp. LLG6367-2.1]|uniref:nitroreductase family protein n=1 Tax=Leeuwenhoekiella sp. LLG6367-2.1 TaxID=3160833 RepID=UPI0038631DA4